MQQCTSGVCSDLTQRCVGFVTNDYRSSQHHPLIQDFYSAGQSRKLAYNNASTTTYSIMAIVVGVIIALMF
eukprot:UN03509